MQITIKTGAAPVTFALAVAVAAGGALYWSGVLRQAPPAMPQPTAAATIGDPTAQALAGWFGPGEVRIDVVVNGLLKSSGQAVAVMAVDGAPPRAYRVGDAVAASATVDAIEADAVVVSRHGEAMRFLVPDPAAGDPAGADAGIVLADSRQEHAPQGSGQKGPSGESD